MQTDIKKAIEVLKKGGTILYPTDTVWGIGCDATNNKAVSKIYSLKNRSEKKSMIVLLDDVSKIKDYVAHYPEQASDLIRDYHKPLTIVFEGAKGLAKGLIADDGTVAIRVVKHDFCKKLIKELGKPVVSTSANVSGDPTAAVFRDITEFIKSKVSYVVEFEQGNLSPANPSTVIKMDSTGSYKVLRS